MSNATFDGVLTDDVVLVCLADERRRRRVTEALREEWPVRTAVDGDAAADSLDDAVSVVVVDGDDVDRSLSPDDDGFETVTLVDEPPDSVEDRSRAWLRKPAAVDEVVSAVERRQRRVTYSRLLEQYYAVASEYAAATTAPDRDPDDLAALKERLFAMRERLDEVADALADVDAFDATLGDHESPDE